MKFTRFPRFGYTLVELMIAIAISLFLLLGVTELFRNVGSSITDTQKTLLMAANLNNVGIQLRSDLDGINAAINQPSRMNSDTYVDSGGYFEIIEGLNIPAVNRGSGTVIPTDGRHRSGNEVFVDSADGNADPTVGDVDDIIMFTATSKDKSFPFRGLVNGNVQESTMAEIAWFVRGKTLYRRVLLINDGSLTNANLSASDFYERNDLSVYRDGTRLKFNTLETLKRREYRFAHGTEGGFPYPIYYFNNSNNREAWYYLRLPTMEETVYQTSPANVGAGGNPNNWPVAGELPGIKNGNDDYDGNFSVPTPPLNSTLYWDLWEQPYNWQNTATNGNWNRIDNVTGSIRGYVENIRNKRAGEDIVMSNVLSFDVKVWNPYSVPCILDSATDPSPGSVNNLSNQVWMWAPPQYIDLGQDRFVLRDANGVLQKCKVNYQQNLNTVPSGVLSPGYAFTLKGRYNASRTNDNRTNNTRRTVSNNNNETEIWHKAERLAINTGTNDVNQLWADMASPAPVPMPCVYDTWTKEYEGPAGTPMGARHPNYNPNDFTTWRCPPPYTEALSAVQVTIRCYDPDSGNIRQLRIVRHVQQN